MTQPRQIIPGATYFVTRRCLERRYLLRPDDEVNDIVNYALAHAAKECSIEIHSYLVMSNHPHLELTDPEARVPEFMRRFNSLVARAVNAFRGRRENLWAPGSYSLVRLVTPEDMMKKMVYILANPVRGLLVTHSRRWPGASSRRWRFGETRTFMRPKVPFFSPDGALPESVDLTLTRPPGFEEMSDDEATAELRKRLTNEETGLRAEARRAKRVFLGADLVKRCDPNDRPGTPEPRRTLKPHVAASDPAIRVAMIEERQRFQTEYARVLPCWIAGDREVVFPPGTYLMRVRYGVNCHPPVPS